MKMLAGNALLALILVGWYFYVQGDTNWASFDRITDVHVQALRNSDDSGLTPSEKTANEHVRALQHVGDNNWMVAGAVMAFVSYLAGITMGYWLRGPGKSRRTAERPASEPAAAYMPATIPAAHATSAADPVAAIPPIEEAQPIEPDIPGPDDLEDLEVESSTASIVEHSIVVAAEDPPV